jgi:hypothetical protein
MYAAYARDEILNKREECFALAMKNIFKYSPGTTEGITIGYLQIQLFCTCNYHKGYFQTWTYTFPPKYIFKYNPAYW